MKKLGLKFKDLKQTCSMCPSQWEGVTTDDEKYYIRFRWGCLTVDRYTGDDYVNSKHIEYDVYAESVGDDDLDGYLQTEDMLRFIGAELVA